MLGAGSIAVLLAGSAWGLTAIENASKDTAYVLSARCFQLQPSFRRQLGVITGSGVAVTGPVVEYTDGTGWAHIQFDFTGSWRGGRGFLRLTRRAGVWRITSGRLLVGDTSYPYVAARTLGSPTDKARCELRRSTTRSPQS